MLMKVVEIIFSPTGGTEKIARMISGQWSDSPLRVDLCDAKADFPQYDMTGMDMALIAMPSFGGRAPAVAIERLKKIAGSGIRCALVCVYGNRAYEDTLVEMEDAARACGFRVIAAIAAVAEHSILPQYATGRPDASDAAQLAGFAARIASKDNEVASLPGNRPYKKSGGAGLVPKAAKECVKCGLCAEKCPVQAIDPADFSADPHACIGCMRCVRQCPHDARKVNSAIVSMAAMAIRKACLVKKENELYL